MQRYNSLAVSVSGAALQCYSTHCYLVIKLLFHPSNYVSATRFSHVFFFHRGKIHTLVRTYFLSLVFPFLLLARVATSV